MRFENMDLLVPGIIIVSFMLVFTAYRMIRLRKINFSNFTAATAAGSAKGFIYLPDILKLAAVILLVIAMLRPQAVKKETQDIIKGIDIMLALDVSGSMQADDLQPNRLEAAKYVCKSFLMGLNNDRVGMVVFAGKSFTQCPLTNDYEIVNSFIDQVGLDTVKVDGTAMGDGIVNCVNRLENSGGSKVIILATDGINNQGIPPDEAAKIAAYKGIKIYTIGIGKKGGAQAFVRLPNGTKQPAVDQFGRYVKWEEPDEAVLTRVADITGGKYFRATDNRALANIYATIGRLEKQDIKVKNYEHKEDKFFIFLLIGVSLLVVAVALEAWKYIRIIR